MIGFSFVDIKFSLPCNNKGLSDFLISLAKLEGRNISNLEYIFTSDNYLLEINKQFLNHNYYTDVITFDSSNHFGIKGEIYISIDYIKSNYMKYSLSFKRELTRCIIHGLLHLLGYDDDTALNKFKMRNKENHYLGLI